MQVTMTVNGEPVTAEVEPRILLVHFLRDQLRLTGTHWGCDTSNCGTCVVEVDGEPVKSCTMLAVIADGEDKPIIGRLKRLVRDDLQMGVALALGDCAAGQLRCVQAGQVCAIAGELIGRIVEGNLISIGSSQPGASNGAIEIFRSDCVGHRRQLLPGSEGVERIGAVGAHG